jgi:hypothetical protein
MGTESIGITSRLRSRISSYKKRKYDNGDSEEEEDDDNGVEKSIYQKTRNKSQKGQKKLNEINKGRRESEYEREEEEDNGPHGLKVCLSNVNEEYATKYMH